MNIKALGQYKELVSAILFIFLVMIVYYSFRYYKTTQEQKLLDRQKIPSLCPDYWKLSTGVNPNEENPDIICKLEGNEFMGKIGRCGNSQDFSGDIFKEDINKCKWSKLCDAPWEGIDNLCADIPK
tara:strand:+ start:776 stop:1153 length:378 start_codon:yes stop_codon:yes gene_type:complete